MKRSTLHRIERLFLIVFSVILISTGVVHIIRGSMGWKNYWGGLVFPPFAVVFGLLLIYVGVSCEKDQEIKRAESWIRSKTTGENGRESHALTSQLRRRGIVPSLFWGGSCPAPYFIRSAMKNTGLHSTLW